MPRKKPPPPKPSRRPRGTGSVGTRKDGRPFCILPPDLDPRRRPIYSPATTRTAFASTDEAAAWLDAEIARRRRPVTQAAGGAEPLGAYLARWHRLYAPTWPYRTATAYHLSLRRWRALASVPLERLTHEVIQGALADLQKSTWRRTRRDGTPTGPPKPYSIRTVRQARTVLGMALGQLVPDVLPHNPVQRTRLGRHQPPQQPVWDGREAARFLASCERVSPALAPAFRLILRRALRRGEVLALRWPDIDEQRAVLVIDETAGERAGEAGDTKGRRTREVPLSRDLLSRLLAHRAAQTRLTPWVFANPETGRPWSRATLARVAAQAIAAAGLPPITPKDMRATCATVLLDEGVPLPRVSQLLGHSSIAVTSQFYARQIAHRQDRNSEIAESLDAAHERAARATGADPGTSGGDTLQNKRHSGGPTR